MTLADEAQQIRQQMDDLRGELRDELQDLMVSARVLSDWQHYVRTYPWMIVAGAVAIGYLVVPRRVEWVTPDTATLERLAAQHKLVIRPQINGQAKSGGVADRLFSLAANMAVRGAMAFAGQQLGKFVGTTAAGQQPTEPAAAATRSH